MTGKSPPQVKIPVWLIKSSFPVVPAYANLKLVKLVVEKNPNKKQVT
jgi:hypothetical protein